MRRVGIEPIGSVPWGTHFCQFYQDRQDLIDILVPYFAAGLEQNECCMWVTSEPLGVEEAKAALMDAIGDLQPYLRTGQLDILDYREWYTIGGQFEAGRVLQRWVEKLIAAQQRGFEGLRLTGNAFWLEQSTWHDFAEYEAAVNGVIGRYPMLAVCTYSLERCGAVEIMDVMSNHAFALIKRGDRWQVIASAERKQVEESRQQVLEAEQARARLAEDLNAEVNHRTKNNLALLSGLLQMQVAADPGGPAADALRQTISRISSLSFVHERLYQGPSGNVDLGDVLSRVAGAAVRTFAGEEAAFVAEVDSVSVSSKLASTFAILTNELVTNAIKYGGPGGDGRRHVRLTLAKQLDGVSLRIWNSGNPVPADFGVTERAGLGLHLVHEVVTGQLDGEFTLRPDSGGTLAEARLPAAALQ